MCTESKAVESVTVEDQWDRSGGRHHRPETDERRDYEMENSSNHLPPMATVYRFDGTYSSAWARATLPTASATALATLALNTVGTM